MRFGKRAILVLSIVATTLIHALFLVIADRIPMIRAHAAVEQFADRFNIRLLEDLPETENPAPEENTPSGLASRPGSIQDLLQSPTEIIEPPGDAAPAMTDIPDLAQRAAAEKVERQYDLTPSDTLLKQLDAKILEIDVTAARENIEIVRRLVRPSPDHILDPNETPVLRTDAQDLMDTPQRFGGVASMLMTRSAQGTTQDHDSADRPPYEILPLPENPREQDPPERKIEAVIAKAPLEKETETLRAASPYAFMDDLIDITLETFTPKEEREGYFRLRISPRKNASAEVLPKQVTFVIDASSSIQQRKLDVTVKGIQEAIGQLRPDDRFNVVIFRDTPTLFQNAQVNATEENKATVRQFLKGVQSRGETDVYKGILPVVQEAPPAGFPGIVLVVSDGRPTAGMRDARTIINGLTNDNDLRNSIFAFGGGNTVDRYLLDLLAYRNKGEANVVKNIDDIPKGLPQFFKRLSDPLLVDLFADYGRIDDEKIFPSVLPDFYQEQPVTIYGRFDPKTDREFFMRLRGRAGGQKKDVVFLKDLREADEGDREIAREWAFQKAYHLIGEISRKGETPGLLGQLQELTRQYNIRTSYSQ